MFQITINTDNAAFDAGDEIAELDRLVQDAIYQLTCGRQEGKLRDANGNNVGEWSLTP